MDRIIHDIVRTAEHAAIFRIIGTAMRGHGLIATLLIGAGIVIVCATLLRTRRSR